MTSAEILQIAKPILFNTEMVRAIMDGRQTVNRRVIKFPDGMIGRLPNNGDRDHLFYPGGIKYPIYKVGDYLYVRETFCKLPVRPDKVITDTYYYKADGDLRPDGWKSNWNPSIHMPKKTARIFLKVTDVRVERLQDITEEQAVKEGIVQSRCKNCNAVFGCDDCLEEEYSEINQFSELWNSTIKESEQHLYGWDANPWVWVYEFERVEVQ